MVTRNMLRCFEFDAFRELRQSRRGDVMNVALLSGADVHVL
jgi:hypothetical protein